MNAIVAHLYVVFVRLGGCGLLALGFLDSSFLFMPLGNDLLMVAMASKQHGRMPYYALMATAGSVLGCVVVDVLSRKGGEKGLEKTLSAKRLKYVTARVKENAGWALSFASLMPPPFPFMAVVAAAAALQYPRRKLFATVAATRFIRFLVEGTLAILLGRRILRLAHAPAVEDGIIGLVILSVVGSALSVYGWINKSKKPGRKTER